MFVGARADGRRRVVCGFTMSAAGGFEGSGALELFNQFFPFYT